MMTANSIYSSMSRIIRLANVSRLTGPIFGKELRVSSRRRRNYILRFLYIIFLAFFITSVWMGVVQFQGSTVYQKSRMAMAGKTIISTIVAFQFFATQLIAIVMLSTSISDEIYHRTLGPLMSTPVSSFQIIMGKLLSKLLQLLLLLGISLPLLAIVRVFGGVPWRYVFSSLCITLTAVIFAGTLSLYFSIHNRRAYVVIVKTAVTLGVLFFFLPTIITAFLSSRWFHTSMSGTPRGLIPLLVIFLHLNPFGALSVNTGMMISPGSAAWGALPIAGAGRTFFYWPVHCVLMLGASALLIALSMKVVRKVALRQATGQLELSPKRTSRRRRKRSSPQGAEAKENAGYIRRVDKSPVLWKELRAPMIQGAEGTYSIIGLAVTIAALIITYGVCAKQKCLDEDFTHISYVMMFVVVGSLFQMILSATSITAEKETRSWPILLATSMDDWHILMGKVGGVIRRCLPVWLLLAGHVVLFVIVGYINPVAIVHLLLFLPGLVIFLTGMGVYFSARCKRTTSAVVATFGLALTLWVIIPFVMGLATISNKGEDVAERYISTHPAVQVSVIMTGAGGRSNAREGLSKLKYEWPGQHSDEGFWPTTRKVASYASIYMIAGVFLAWGAKRRFRRKIF
jgi:ABC-2 type transport system permease protein